MCGCIARLRITFRECTAKSFKLDNIAIIYDYGNNDLAVAGNFTYFVPRPD